MKKTIDILQFGDFHLELVPAFLELLTQCNNAAEFVIRINRNADSAGWLEYCATTFPDFRVVLKTTHPDRDSIKLFLTAGEVFHLPVLPRDSFLINHTPAECKIGTTVALTPLVNRNFILPIYRTPVFHRVQLQDVIIGVVGISTSENKSFSDMATILSTFPRVKIVFFTRQVSKDTVDLANLFRGRVLLEFSNTAVELVRKIKSYVSFLLLTPSEKSYHLLDRLSGMIPLSLSCNIPLVTDTKIKSIYSLKSSITLNEFLSFKEDDLFTGSYSSNFPSTSSDFNYYLGHNYNELQRLVQIGVTSPLYQRI